MEKNEVQEVKEKNKDFSVVLAEKLSNEVQALPKEFNQTRFVQNAIALLNEHPELQKYGAKQVMSGLVRGAYLGLDFYAKEAYLVPRSGKLCYQTSYIGDVKLCKKYSLRSIKDIYAKVVRQGDLFEEKIINGEPTITFAPKTFNEGAIIGAFAVCLYKDGGLVYDTMNLSELENTRKHAQASNSPAWKDFKEEMYKKTVIHRLCKHIELDFENVEQRSIFDNDMAIKVDEQEEYEAPDVMEEDVIDIEVVDDET